MRHVSSDVRRYYWRVASPMRLPRPLAADTTHVWCASLDEPPIAHQRLFEIARDAERVARERDRLRSVAARGLLRMLLASYLDIRPDDVQLRLGAHGKPHLSNPQGLQFNVSHAHDLALYAVTRSGEVGVDLEHVRPIASNLRIAKRFFTPGEFEAIVALPEQERDQAFFRCWTRKEAYVKARGGGLSIPLNEFQVEVEPASTATLLRSTSAPEEVARWQLYDLQPAPDFIGAVCVERHVQQIACWMWAG